MDIVATQKHLITSPRKLRDVVYLIKKMNPSSAVERLPFTGKKAAGELRKVVMTALANAKVRGINADSLEFKEIQIGEGPRLKRFRAGSRGRAKPYKRRMSHIRIVLTTRDNQVPSSDTQTNSETNQENETKKPKRTLKSILSRNKKGEAK